MLLLRASRDECHGDIFLGVSPLVQRCSGCAVPVWPWCLLLGLSPTSSVKLLCACAGTWMAPDCLPVQCVMSTVPHDSSSYGQDPCSPFPVLGIPHPSPIFFSKPTPISTGPAYPWFVCGRPKRLSVTGAIIAGYSALSSNTIGAVSGSAGMGKFFFVDTRPRRHPHPEESQATCYVVTDAGRAAVCG